MSMVKECLNCGHRLFEHKVHVPGEQRGFWSCICDCVAFVRREPVALEQKLFLAQCVNDALVILNQQLNREVKVQGTHSKAHWILTLGARK